ncbi:MAG: class I SAM-dependent DNA methyltransferase [Flavobacterium sp.]|nr:class I SAM-dependent DNA methyltransferase [Flavobacterium sp.]
MNIQLLEPRKALNKAFLKIKPNRTGIELFKSNLIAILDSINEKESEEFHKNLVIEFLKKTYYDPTNFVNTKGRNDLVIHNGKDAKTSVGVIIEVKSPTNKSEMVSVDNLNGKALQELVLYYMRERITHKNTELKHVVISNIHEWFVFDAQLFNKLFAENKTFVKQFIDFEEKRLSGSKTDYFYNDIAKPYIASLQGTIEFAHFDIRKYDKPLRNNDKNDDKSLIALFKLLSPEHLLKLSFANDSNSLDKNFYNELLHIIGLTEVKEGGKKLIKRHEKENRNDGSLLENAILQLESEDKLNYISNLKQYGDNKEQQLFAIGLELTITWVNRILFLKLLEAQLISYHKGDKSYSFLNAELIKDYDVLNNLFFKVLAKKTDERIDRLVKDFEKVPYLNSSLFEPTELERIALSINQLEDNISLPLLPSTVIKDANGKKVTGTKNALNYFFSFLDAYDFASEGSEDIQEDNKTLINASVLGLIFEKINGYKDGSFFTPSFITMYMCKETIRRTVLQKFNDELQWSCNDFSELYNNIKDKKEANSIINSIKICDPAVGSGHFLVSALNEIIAIKHDLGILIDNQGKTLRDYAIEVVNDELIITDDDGIPFQYNISNKESQRIQETLFHEKQTIIENCLFGVDLNPNSVKICRLRLWIELLKNAYYKNDSNELETLPNIDINIKCGNSLISRFDLDADLKQTLKKSKLTIQSYKDAVKTYQNADSKEQKKEMEDLIANIKSNFKTEISANSKEIRDLQKITFEYNNKYVTEQLFEVQLTKAQLKDKKQLEEKIKNHQAIIDDIKTNKIYENAFEWRFEFPEVLNDEGDFIGFDAIIGNPPYIQLQKMGVDGASLEKMKFETYVRTGDIYSLFYELGFKLLKENGLLAYITSNKWMRAAYGESLRKYFVEKTNPFLLLDFGGVQVFDSATVDTNILIGCKAKYDGNTNACLLNNDFDPELLESFIKNNSTSTRFKNESWVVLSSVEKRIKEKIEKIGTPLKDWDINIYRGILTGYNDAFIIDGKKRDELIKEDPKSADIIRLFFSNISNSLVLN